jgi:hypothetical protein
MNIRVADAAVGDGNEHILRADLTPLERKGLQGSLSGHRGVALGQQHGAYSFIERPDSTVTIARYSRLANPRNEATKAGANQPLAQILFIRCRHWNY